MIKAAYADRPALEAVLAQALQQPREPVTLELESGEQLVFMLHAIEGGTALGTMVDPPRAHVAIDLETLEVTLT